MKKQREEFDHRQSRKTPELPTEEDDDEDEDEDTGYKDTEAPWTLGERMP